MSGVKSQDMLLLEESFKDLKTKNNTIAAIERIRRIVKRNFDIDFNINIINNDTNKFFGMTIYPDTNQLQLIIEEIVNKRSSSDTIVKLWQKNKVWNLEIDSILLYDSRLNANPAELVAVLLHEMGHIIYSNTVPQRVNKIIRYKLMSSSIALKKLVTWGKVQKLIQLVFIEACNSKNYHYTNLRVERIADQFVVKMNYGDSLNEFIDKLIATQGNEFINRQDTQLDKDIEAAVNWTFINITELQFRKKKLRDTLRVELLKNPSMYIRSIVDDIKVAFFGSSKEIYDTALTEQYLVEEFNSVLKESYNNIFDKYGKVKKVSQSDIDVIEIECGRIENEDDKIYVLDLIYDKLDIIETALDFIANNKRDKVQVSKDPLNSYKKQLDNLRRVVLGKEIRPKQYGVFIKYPKGYEG